MDTLYYDIPPTEMGIWDMARPRSEEKENEYYKLNSSAPKNCHHCGHPIDFRKSDAAHNMRVSGPHPLSQVQGEYSLLDIETLHSEVLPTKMGRVWYMAHPGKEDFYLWIEPDGPNYIPRKDGHHCGQLIHVRKREQPHYYRIPRPDPFSQVMYTRYYHRRGHEAYLHVLRFGTSRAVYDSAYERSTCHAIGMWNRRYLTPSHHVDADVVRWAYLKWMLKGLKRILLRIFIPQWAWSLWLKEVD